MSARRSLRLPARLESLKAIEEAVSELARDEEWPGEHEFQVKLVLDELGSNIVNYGDNGVEDREFEVELISDDETITIEIIDDGKPFDPFTQAPEPDTDSSLEDRPIGGLGVHLVRTMMDDTQYHREGDRNRITLVKRRT